MKRPRDFQRSRVYRSEGCLSEPPGEYGGRLDTMDDIRSFLDEVYLSRWIVGWMKRKGMHIRFNRVVIGDGRGRKKACAEFHSDGTCMLKFPRWTRSRLMALHEIAHTIVDPVNHAAHGRHFCAAYLELVRRWIGKEAHAELKKAFEENKVKFRRR